MEWLRCRNCEDKCEKDLSERGLRVVEECQEKCKQAWRDACDEKVNPLHDCHRWCEREYPNWSKLIERSTCKAKCNGGLTPQEIKCDDKCRNPITARLDKECFSKCNEDFKLHSQEATISDINTSEDIKSSFYSLADSVSV
ncbi:MULTISPECIES: hypothetical protein [unclassified Wolbachia]|uniref:hypothetical protein n=1 Tax=unclassified Wolbachia TaxID=2640676 RepID=UPI00222705D7|nr:hypothetical protein [Wolbachia endosymbiont (group B) of Euphydryas aurinia]